MSICSKCHQYLTPWENFCADDGGNALAYECPGCGESLSSYHKFCKKCGRDLAGLLDKVLQEALDIKVGAV